MFAYKMCRIIVFVLMTYFFDSLALFMRANETDSFDIESVPFVASLLTRRGHICAASVIHERFLITAASCFEDDNASKVLVGTSNLENSGFIYEIDTFLPHEKYFKQIGDYNVGLIKLKTKLTFGNKVKAIEVTKRTIGVGSDVSVVGWGSSGNKSKTLIGTTIPVVPSEQCFTGTLGRYYTPRKMCAGIPGIGEGDCVSDEGGPVYKKGELIGLATPATGCGRLPGVYTRLDVLNDWVNTTIYKNLPETILVDLL